MKYSVGYAASLGERDIISAMEFALGSGFEAVELNMNMPCFFPERYDQEDINAIKKFKNEHGIKLTMHAPEDISLVCLHEGIRLAGIQRLQEIIGFAYEIGVSCITVHTNSTPYFTLVEGQGYVQDEYADKAVENLNDSLKRILDYRDENADGVEICIENSGYFPKYIQEALKKIMDVRRLNLTWDIGHSYLNKYGEVEFFKGNLESIRVSHIHDYNEQGDHKVIGSGNVKFKEHMDIMGNEDVVYVIEVRPREEAAKSLEALKNII
ncbi:Sugar phosphate isomerase/epimerase [Peptoclostridium litorale DSM 5388]|uniref:AP endonuclease family 2 protein n=1 Tax=Peptoclostridium litorale DSM 5388 TaxID=1121324 RepID=A0A069RGI2_PEPLI|nr:sugar phosphate isomerase/epimerase family protein [Peptoclostridium litorale]KDR96124.1 AP endonuclease family 2 protein [Peptoclostridium litorale DSM 5388]SIO04123.1 Sugar phosphate isomerase/epimerase [Peptoclostridium litorale DSM 5388]